MNRLAALTLAASALLAACQDTQPRAGAWVGITPDGVRVYPQIGVQSGNVGLVISP
ncbi:hypothetical protein OCGS_1632 [Oceaniovalibus guishaninsula JLT2003]|uniref:Lipoprotein n=1 Tax=Oceaniovalibus guishaninsula JLT2003 TaxID=1231392 RepID=K2GN96_9RHOB|nr:hypothetical protein [Oceaniovalibus guishaninsula]EKE44116.1 hypothetical protein OCGS_1632 [Oceaniovalibus guishaninsula JLT2003]